jgi:hypothetical protein
MKLEYLFIFLSIFMIILVISSCSSVSVNRVHVKKDFKVDNSSTNRNLSKVEFENHSYIILWTNHDCGNSILHDPDCNCLKNKITSKD